jgi:selenocysteine lyase/cysteine desulfurase
MSDLSCGSANFHLAGVKPVALGSYLMAQHKIITTPIIHEEFQSLRITLKIYTTLKELDRFCAVVEQVATKGGPVL